MDKCCSLQFVLSFKCMFSCQGHRNWEREREKVVQLQQRPGELRFCLPLLTISCVSTNLVAFFLPFLKNKTKPQNRTVRSHLIARNNQNVKLVLHSFFVPYAIIHILRGKNIMSCFQERKKENSKEIMR